jgi:hypothetical protein
MDKELTPDEKLAIQWLRDENQIQRTISHTRSGKTLNREDDISGGQGALTRILRNIGVPLSPSLRLALAGALEPIGVSVLRLEKRPSRTVGRPAKGDSVRSAVRDAFEVTVYSNEVLDEAERLGKSQPQQAAGIAMPEPAVIEQALHNVGEKRKIGRSKAHSLCKRANGGSKTLKNKKKQLP